MGTFIRTILAAASTILLLAISSAGMAQPTDSACMQRKFESDRFTVCAFGASRDELRLLARDTSGKAYRRLPRLAEAPGDDASRFCFAMNAGMFDETGASIGLYVENGKTLKTLNTRDGDRSFNLKPNGVFWIGADGDVRVSTTVDYEKQKPTAKWATQSGPMLVIDGKLHPAFSHDGKARHVRDGVGRTGERRAVFVISDDEVSFGKLVRFFRDELKVDDALDFDGAVSSLWSLSITRMDSARDLGPMIVVTSL